jgi:hypothetical protein
VAAATGAQLGHRTEAARPAGHGRLLEWARLLDGERVWAIEDCRHVSGGLERFLVAHGERVVRVAPKLMAGARKSARERGKSDPIDSTAVARAALREGIGSLPTAHLDERALDIRLLLDHHDISSPSAATISAGCVGICTICGPSFTSLLGRWIAPSGWTRSLGVWPARNRPLGCASRVSWSTRSVNAPARSARWSASWPSWWPPTHRCCWPSRAAAR